MRTVSQFSLIALLLLICSSYYFFSSIEKPIPNSIESVSDGPAHPGWEEDWFLMKKEFGREIPVDFPMNIYKEMKNRSFRNESLLKDLNEIGPDNVAGRIRAFQVDYTNTNRYLAAGISGGLWESLDRGVTWKNLTPQEQFLNITSLTQSPFNSNVFYFSTGEGSGNSAGISGAGIFKSTDGAQTFQLLPGTEVTDFTRTWRIRHSPVDTNTFFVASSNALFSSTDGGVFIDPLVFGNITDIEIRPSGEMYVGADSRGIYYSADGSPNSFVLLDEGLPEDFGRIELAISPADTNLILASLESVENGRILDVYASYNNGLTWELLTNPEVSAGISASFAWYCHSLFVHPTNPDFMIVGASRGAYSLDGGESWMPTSGVHADLHNFRLDPQNENELLFTSDGGINRFELFHDSELLNVTTLNEGLNITQFYTGAVFPNGNVLGGTQDNGTWFVEKSGAYEKVFGGDGAGCAVNPLNPTEIYVSYQRGNVFRMQNFMQPEEFSEFISGDILNSEENMWFINPFQINPIVPNQVFMPSHQRLWTSDSRGDNWIPMTDTLDILPYRIALKQHENKTALFIVGSSAGLYRIDDINDHEAGDEVDLNFSAPSNVTGAFLRQVIAHPNEDVLYVVMSSFSNDPRVWEIKDIFSSDPVWTSISGDLPEGIPVNSIAQNQDYPNIMAIGTDYGLFTTNNGGDNWVLEWDVPQTVIYQVILKEDYTLHIFTHGRGIFQATLSDFASPQIEVNDDFPISIYPNPTTDVINIDCSILETNMVVKIRDVQGKVVLAAKGQRRINVSSLRQGLYMLELMSSGRQFGISKFEKM